MTAPADSFDYLAGNRILCAFSGPVVPDNVLELIRTGRAAGVVVSRDNLVSEQQAQQNAAAIQSAASQAPNPVTAIVATNEEGGQITQIDGPPTLSAHQLGRQSLDKIILQAQATGRLMKDWAINLDLAPVADVVRPDGFEVTQQRSFGDDSLQVTAEAAGFVNGLHMGGVAATLKYFPGLGASTVDPNDGVATVQIDVNTLDTVDLVPFDVGIRAGADAVMIASATYPALGPDPIVLSPDLVNNGLRNHLGFTGVTISDALDSPALSAFGTPEELAVRAAPAVDLFITTPAHDCTTVELALADAIRQGPIDPADALAAAGRVAHLRTNM